MNRTQTALLTLLCILLFGLVLLYGLNAIPCQQAAMKSYYYEWQDGNRVRVIVERDDE